MVEEPVLQRTISGVVYRRQDARVFDIEDSPVLLGTVTKTNQSDNDIVAHLTVTYKDARSYSFTNDFSINTTDVVASTIQAGIPSIVDAAHFDILPEIIIDPFKWEYKTRTGKPKEATYPDVINVPAWTRVTVNYWATRAKCSVPFSYTQEDKLISDDDDDDDIATYNYDDGIFHGANYYSCHFDDPHFEPL